MADPQPQWRGNALQRFGRGVVDRVLPGNQRGADGTLTNVGRGVGGLALRVGGNVVGGPLGGLIGNQLGTNLANNGNPVNFEGNTSRLSRLLGLGGGTPSGPIGPVQRMPIQTGTPGGGMYGVVPDIGVGPLSIGRPQLNGTTAPSLVNQLNAYRGSQGSGAPAGPVGAVQRQPIAGPDTTVSVPDVNVGPIGINRQNMVINGPNGPASPAPRGMMGGGASGGTFTRGGTDAGVITGDAAREMFAGMRMGGLFGHRQSSNEAM